MGLKEQGQRYIWIIRHAKSAEGEPGMSDHDRPLNRRGERDGQAMHTWFKKQAHPAQWVWSSTATRARLTAEFVSSAYNIAYVVDRGLYLASAERILECLQATPAEITATAIVAHNPGLTHLVNRLAESPVTENLVTFGTALFTTNKSWQDLRPGCATLMGLHTPKTI